VRLGLVVFLAGGGTLATEIGASRLLAPYFGSSTVVWANIIGLILVYLAIGYWLGGKLADRHPSPALLGRIILVASLLVAATPFAARPLLRLALDGFDSLAVGEVAGSFVGALLLFALPVTLLGTVSPFAVRLAVVDVASAGAVAGRLYALSTAGSIAGTFLSALVAIPLAGTQRTFVGTAALLALAAAALLPRRWLVVAGGLVVLLALPVGAVKAEPGLLYEHESRYQFVQVLRQPDGARVLQLNEGVAVHSVWRRDTVLTGGYWDLFDVLPPLLGRAPRAMLVIGNAGGTIPRAYGRFYPGIAIDGVEIDPVVTEAGRRYLGLGDNPRLRTITADGRPFLERTHRRYDLIVVDAYRQPYVPFYLTTEEFFRLVRSRLEPGGIVALNVAATPGDRRLTAALAASLLAGGFAQAWTWPALRYNDLLLGLERPATRDELLRRAERVPRAVRPLLPLLRRELEPSARAAQPLTDDRAPVEWLTDRMIFEAILRGRGLDERELPTAPR
jgi:predicted membrane-bound spermidine synthase